MYKSRIYIMLRLATVVPLVKGQRKALTLQRAIVALTSSRKFRLATVVPLVKGQRKALTLQRTITALTTPRKLLHHTYIYHS